MEGTVMVAHAFLPSLYASPHTALTPIEVSLAEKPTPDSVKLLDLLTNRYHLGLLRASSESALELELPLTSHLFAGQRVRFIVAGNSPLVARHAMRGACITHVGRAPGNRLRVELALSPESAAA
jgi:hypothetical protein